MPAVSSARGMVSQPAWLGNIYGWLHGHTISHQHVLRPSLSVVHSLGPATCSAGTKHQFALLAETMQSSAAKVPNTGRNDSDLKSTRLVDVVASLRHG
jgi:hypothetical protein